ncbi:ROK family transcriptional regulator [Ethanoligenens sp.]|uniref:ROK family transcriptional regulator n=1 Tax=Ethanoligenens sp. TaxID=2099655 RepID=UPI0039EBD324
MEGYNHQKVKKSNRNLILKLIVTNESISRVELSELSGLTKMTVSNIVSELIAQNVVVENKSDGDETKTTSGRKPSMLDVSDEAPCVVGMYLSRKYCYTLLTDMKADILYSGKTRLSDYETPESLVLKFLQAFFYIREHYDRKILGIGITSVGPVDIAKKILLNPLNQPNLNNLAIGDMVHRATELPVFVDNDAKASALAENIFGNGRGYNNFIYVGITNTISMGAVSNGELLERNSGVYGQIGHTCINFNGPKCECGSNGCLELYAGIDRIVDKARFLIRNRKESALWGTRIHWIDLVEAAMAQDRFALEIVDEFCEYITIALVNLVNIMDCDAIIIGHEAAIANSLITDILQERVNERCFRSQYKKVAVLTSEFMDKAPLIGAASLSIDKIFTGELALY